MTTQAPIDYNLIGSIVESAVIEESHIESKILHIMPEIDSGLVVESEIQSKLVSGIQFLDSEIGALTQLASAILSNVDVQASEIQSKIESAVIEEMTDYNSKLESFTVYNASTLMSYVGYLDMSAVSEMQSKLVSVTQSYVAIYPPTPSTIVSEIESAVSKLQSEIRQDMTEQSSLQSKLVSGVQMLDLGIDNLEGELESGLNLTTQRTSTLQSKVTSGIQLIVADLIVGWSYLESVCIDLSDLQSKVVSNIAIEQSYLDTSWSFLDSEIESGTGEIVRDVSTLQSKVVSGIAHQQLDESATLSAVLAQAATSQLQSAIDHTQSKLVSGIQLMTVLDSALMSEIFYKWSLIDSQVWILESKVTSATQFLNSAVQVDITEGSELESKLASGLGVLLNVGGTGGSAVQSRVESVLESKLDFIVSWILAI